MGIGHSLKECSPLYHGEVPTHPGVVIIILIMIMIMIMMMIIIIWLSLHFMAAPSGLICRLAHKYFTEISCILGILSTLNTDFPPTFLL